jgi:DNA polymerase III delta prime subunit
MTNQVELDYINEMYERSFPSIYVVNLMSIKEKQQNVLLKLVEEPLNNTFIILIAENKGLVLPTILNRTIVLELAKYKKEDLKTFVTADNEDLLNIFHTPGQLIQAQITDLKGLQDLCYKIVDKMSVAAYSNALTIANKINYSNEMDKYDIYVFFDMLVYCLFEKYQATTDKKILSIYKETITYRTYLLQNSLLNKKCLMENYLTHIWQMSQENK